MSVRLYVGNLPKAEIAREDLQAIFTDEGEADGIKLVKDRKTGKCRGFGFITVETDEIADAFVAKYNGIAFQDAQVLVEKALPKEKPESAAEDGSGGEEGTPAATNGDGEGKGDKRKDKNARRGGKKSGSGGGKKGGGTPKVYASNNNTDIQPDPRWADKLAEIKAALANANA
jgi:RNA recognition motif-containing protein